MSALTSDRHTAERVSQRYTYPIASNTLCYAGGLATLTSAGYVRPGTVDGSSPTSVAIGRFCQRCDNRTDASQLDAATTADVECGVFRWDNYASDPVTAASIQHACYVLDDQTVAATSAGSTRGTAGIVMAVDTDGVWVATGVPVSASVTATPAMPVYVGTVPLAAASNGVLRYVATRAGVIKSFGSVLSAAVATGSAIVTCSINSTGVTGGVQTIPVLNSAANVTQITTPSALNSFAAGDVLVFTVTGAATGAATAAITVNITEA